jgi:hypothetical protein
MGCFTPRTLDFFKKPLFYPSVHCWFFHEECQFFDVSEVHKTSNSLILIFSQKTGTNNSLILKILQKPEPPVI